MSVWKNKFYSDQTDVLMASLRGVKPEVNYSCYFSLNS